MRPGEIALDEREVVLIQVESQSRVAAVESYHLPARGALVKGALQAPPVRGREHVGILPPVFAFDRLVVLDIDDRLFLRCRHMSKQHAADFGATDRCGPETPPYRGVELFQHG